MEKSNISWTDGTFNPWWGCARVSPGCQHCYAESFAARIAAEGSAPLWGAKSERRLFGDKHWGEPLHWQWKGFMLCPDCGGDLPAKLQRGSGIPLAVEMCACGSKTPPRTQRRRRVFCGSMCDWLEDREDLTRPLARLLALIHATPLLTWQLLTKRPGNWRKRLTAAAQCVGPGNIIEQWLDGEAPDNVWMGATAENQAMFDERLEALSKVPARVRFLSVEPMLGPVNIPACAPVDWVICGGESGKDRREFQPEWAGRLAAQCAINGTAFFMKQDGGLQPGQQGRLADDLWSRKQFPTEPALS